MLIPDPLVDPNPEVDPNPVLDPIPILVNALIFHDNKEQKW